jgi:hypothetical protein
MAAIPAIVRLITLPLGRSATKAAEALADLAVGDHHTATNGDFYKRYTPIQPPEAALDTDSQGRSWETCHLATGRGRDSNTEPSQPAS